MIGGKSVNLGIVENMNSTQVNASNTVPLLKTRQLCKDFPPSGFWGAGIRAVDGVDMEVEPGEIHGIVGESSSGKTTLARCCMQLIKPSSGTVYFDGKDLSTLSPAYLRARRQEFQMVFQDPYASLNPGMTVEEILLEPLHIHRVGNRGSRNRHVRELLDAVSLSEALMNRKPAELSGGQQQRVGIARGLALKPRLLVADEPVSALDASVQAQILNLLADLKKRYHLTLVLIAHSLYAIHYLCDRVSVMYRGRIVEEAPAAEFFGRPKHPYSRLLFDSMPAFASSKEGRGHAAEKNPPPSKVQSSCAFYPRCPQAFSRCGEQIPILKELNPGEKIACFLWQ